MKKKTCILALFFSTVVSIFSGQIIFDWGFQSENLSFVVYNFDTQKRSLPFFKRGPITVFIVVTEDGKLIPDPEWVIIPNSSPQTRRLEKIIPKGKGQAPQVISGLSDGHQELIKEFFNNNSSKSIFIKALYKFHQIPFRWAETNPISETDVIKIEKNNYKEFRRIQKEMIPASVQNCFNEEVRKIFVEEN